MPPRATLPAFPYGAVYFRKSNPPRADWERDYATAAADGLNAFRHWFLWSAIETAPDVFDWADYDAQLDLAARFGLKTIIAEFITAAPEWAWRALADARYEAADGRRAHSTVSPSCAVGGFPGLCLDHPAAQERAGHFLGRLVERYRDHPGLGAYDVWNECNIPRQYCFCPATQAQFRAWLRQRYGDLQTLGEVWHRHSYASWDDVQAPRDATGYAESLDWLQFRIDNTHRLLRWRADLIRSLDPHHPVTAHGVAQTLTDHATGTNDEWRAASEVDSYGFTWIAARRGDEPWKHLLAVDLVRSGARGKPFWHAEAQAGPLWLQPQVLGRPRDDGRVAQPQDIRYWSLTSFAGGATGWLCPRWRPLLDGPLFGAFGMYAMDGSRTPRSAMVAGLARWATAPEQADLWRARPVQGEVAILFVPESNLFAQVQQGSTDWYAECVRGAYQGFLDLGLQPDIVHIDDLPDARYGLVYLPYPVHLRQSSAERIRRWVEAGGTLVSEGCPGYFGDHGHVGAQQPHLGLDTVFGVREQDVEFMPDIADERMFSLDGRAVPGAIFWQTYAPAGGQAVGFVDRAAVVVDHAYGAGRTRLVGTFPGAARSRAVGPLPTPGRPSGTTFTTHRAAQLQPPSPAERLAASQAFYAALLDRAGITPHVRSDDPQLIVRLHHEPQRDALYLWALNPTPAPRTACLALAPRWGVCTSATSIWGEHPLAVDPDSLRLTVAPRDALIAHLHRATA